jgi:hypothetical protein
MVSLFVLSRSALFHSSLRDSLNSRQLTLLQTLCRRQKSQLLWNQANPHSLRKTSGVGCTVTSRPRRIRNIRTPLSRRVCNLVNAIPRVLALCFHNDTNPSSSNSFHFTSIQNAGGVTLGALCAPTSATSDVLTVFLPFRRSNQRSKLSVARLLRNGGKLTSAPRFAESPSTQPAGKGLSHAEWRSVQDQRMAS